MLCGSNRKATTRRAADRDADRVAALRKTTRGVKLEDPLREAWQACCTLQGPAVTELQRVPALVIGLRLRVVLCGYEVQGVSGFPFKGRGWVGLRVMAARWRPDGRRRHPSSYPRQHA